MCFSGLAAGTSRRRTTRVHCSRKITFFSVQAEIFVQKLAPSSKLILKGFSSYKIFKRLSFCLGVWRLGASWTPDSELQGFLLCHFLKLKQLCTLSWFSSLSKTSVSPDTQTPTVWAYLAPIVKGLSLLWASSLDCSDTSWFSAFFINFATVYNFALICCCITIFL